MKQLFTNAKIYTGAEEQTFVKSMLVKDRHVIWTGEQTETGYASGAGESDCEIVDLGGRTVVPGFIDAHMHPMMLAEYSRQIACMPPNVDSIDNLIRLISEAAGETPNGDWILGWGLDENKFSDERLPDRYDLDRGCADKPVFIVRCCEHIRCVNSKVLEIAGITKDTPDPPGGNIDRDENGEPTGILRENARDLVMPFMPKQTESDLVGTLVDLGDLLKSQGIVAIADMGNLRAGGNYAYYVKAAARGFCQRVSMYYMWDYFENDPEFEIKEKLIDGDRRLRMAGLKLIGDGSISGRTAWVKAPYLSADGRTSDEYGMPVYTDESIEKAIAFAKKNECQISVHAMGGRAIDRIIDRVYEEDKWTSNGAPHLRVEHATEPSESAIAKAVEKGIAFVSQPIFEYCEIESYKTNLGEDHLKTLYPYKTLLDRGASLCFSSDAPATSWATPSDPLVSIKSAVTRRAYDGTDTGQNQRVDVETGINLYTKNAAEICGFNGLGQLVPGYCADFVVLSDDIFTIDPDQIDRIEVEQTYIDGTRVY